MAAFLLGNTISGLPGKCLACRRKRKPSLCSKRRTTISDAVFFGPKREIKVLRLSGVRLLTIVEITMGGEKLFKSSFHRDAYCWATAAKRRTVLCKGNQSSLA
jgi:hypothetical protein